MSSASNADELRMRPRNHISTKWIFKIRPEKVSPSDFHPSMDKKVKNNNNNNNNDKNKTKQNKKQPTAKTWCKYKKEEICGET